MAKPKEWRCLAINCLILLMVSFICGCGTNSPPSVPAAQKPLPPPPPPPSNSATENQGDQAITSPTASPDEVAKRPALRRNLQIIGLYLNNYSFTRKTLPPAYSSDKDGKPLLSWRVLILPFIDGKLYKEFHLDEPWDSDHNKRLIALMPATYRDPDSRLPASEGKTNYLAVRGANSLFPGALGVDTHKDIPDGRAKTIMVVEASDSMAVVWTKPDDFAYEPTDPKKGLIGLRPQGFFVVFADGAVQFLHASIAPNVLLGLFTRNGGEPVSFDR